MIGLFTGLVLLAAEPSPLGYWQTEDKGGVIEVLPCGEATICARLAGIVMDHPGDAMPTDWEGHPQCGFPLIKGADREAPNLWRGKITDPRNGGVYGVEVHVTETGLLAVRGYLAFSLFGRTDYWHRSPVTPPADCRMSADEAKGGG